MPAIPAVRTLQSLAISVVAGTASALFLMPPGSRRAMADAAADALFAYPSPEEYLARGALAALLVGAGVKAMRSVRPDVFAPSPATPRSRLLTLLAALALGLGLGVIGTAPPVAFGLAGKLVGGAGVGLLAYFGAKGVGAVKRRKAKSEGGP